MKLCFTFSVCMSENLYHREATILLYLPAAKRLKKEENVKAKSDVSESGIFAWKFQNLFIICVRPLRIRWNHVSNIVENCFVRFYMKKIIIKSYVFGQILYTK